MVRLPGEPHLSRRGRPARARIEASRRRPDGRLIKCKRCGAKVVICRHCDRGNVYCSRACAKEVRLETQRRSSARYQQTMQGKRHHAAREKRRRERLAQKVTQQGPSRNPDLREMEPSLSEPALPPSPHEAEAQPDAEPPAVQQLSDLLVSPRTPDEPQPGTMVCCPFCGGWCHYDGRQGPALRSGSVTRQRRGPRLPRASRAPPPPG